MYMPVKPRLSEEKRITPDRITDDRPLYQDLDSMSIEELIMAFEDEFDLRIPDGVAAGFHTVGDAIRYLEDRVKRSAEG
ncbi:MAG: acyl carrier protein [Lentisphaeria bacterium]|nr:acyl carrier protein [Lentisphaeria bacterium]